MALQAQALARRVGARRVRLAVSRKIEAHRRREAPRVDRLLDEAIAADREARVTVAFGRDGDDRDPFEGRFAPAAAA